MGKALLVTLFCVCLLISSCVSTPDHLFPVLQNGKVGYIDREGNIVVTPRFELGGWFHEGMGRVKVGDKWGFIDATGKMVVEPKFDDAKDFSDGHAAVSVNEKWGFIDKTGKFLIEPKVDDATDFSGWVARVEIYGKGEDEQDREFLIDRSGKCIYEYKQEEEKEDEE